MWKLASTASKTSFWIFFKNSFHNICWSILEIFQQWLWQCAFQNDKAMFVKERCSRCDVVVLVRVASRMFMPTNKTNRKQQSHMPPCPISTNLHASLPTETRKYLQFQASSKTTLTALKHYKPIQYSNSTKKKWIALQRKQQKPCSVFLMRKSVWIHNWKGHQVIHTIVLLQLLFQCHHLSIIRISSPTWVFF